jgi:RNA polymerase sigma-70 factor (ECF subfamily)
MRIPPRPETEARIAGHLDAGDFRAAATTAIQEYGPEILGYLFPIVRDADLAADAFSRFAEDLWKGIRSFRRDSSFRNWAYRIAWNAACDELDDPYRRRGRRLLTNEVSGLVEKVRTNSAEFLKPEAHEKLERLRALLTPDEQALLTLYANRGLSWREVAQALSRPGRRLSEAAVRKRYQRIKEKLARNKL